jgi:hypothetical protein
MKAKTVKQRLSDARKEKEKRKGLAEKFKKKRKKK